MSYLTIGSRYLSLCHIYKEKYLRTWLSRQQGEKISPDLNGGGEGQWVQQNGSGGGGSWSAGGGGQWSNSMQQMARGSVSYSHIELVG